MLTNQSPLYLGVILCKYCNCTIDTLDTDNVVIYYSECDQAECQAKRNVKGEIYDEY